MSKKRFRNGLLVATGTLMTVGAIGMSGLYNTAQASAQQPLVMGVGPLGSFQDNFNPYSSSAVPDTSGLMYQSLFYFNGVASNVYPLLGVKDSWSNHNRTLTVHLRHGVKWSDATPFTSADVVFTFDMLKKYPALDTTGVWAQLASVKAAGKYAVRFNFKAANVPFSFYVLTVPIVPQHIWNKYSNPVTETNPNPVGTGPYVLQKFSSSQVTESSNTNYWGGKPPVQTLEFPAFDSNTSADLAMVKGQVDWGGWFIPNIQTDFINKNKKQNHYWFPLVATTTLYPNLKDPLLSQLPVRKAISMGIDRTKLDQLGEYGFNPPAGPTSLVLPTYSSWKDKHLPAKDFKAVAYNPKGAMALLEKAGYKKNASGIFVSPSGKPLSFTLDVVSGWTDWDSDCSLIEQELRAIGIQIKVQEMQYGAYYSAVHGGTYQLAISWQSTGGFSPYYAYQGMLNPQGGWDVEQWSNPATTKALNDYSKTTNRKVQQRAIDVLESTMVNQVPAIPLMYATNFQEYSTKNFTGFPDASHPYAFGQPGSGAAAAEILLHLKPVH